MAGADSKIDAWIMLIEGWDIVVWLVGEMLYMITTKIKHNICIYIGLYLYPIFQLLLNLSHAFDKALSSKHE